MAFHALRLLPVLMASIILASASPTAGRAQVPSTQPVVSAAASTQAQQALDVLKDDRRRAELITTLEAIAKAAPVLAPSHAAAPVTVGNTAPAAGPAPAQPITKIPLEPDSLGVAVIDQVSAVLSLAGSQLLASLRSVNDLPLLGRWIVNQATDPDARALILDAAWKLAVVLCAGLGLEWGANRVLRRFRQTLVRGLITESGLADIPADTPALAAETGLAAAEAGESEHAVRARRLSGTLSAFRRLPYLLGQLALDLIPVGLFAIVTNMLLGSRLGQPASARGTILLVIQCYIGARLILALAAMLASPVSPQLRLLHISDWAANFLTRWIRRTAIIAIAGYAIAGAGLQFGMYRTAYDTLLKLFAFAVHVCLVLAVLQARVPIARRIHARHGVGGVWAAFLNRAAETWHLVAIFYIVALWLVWAVELRNGYIRLIHFFIVTAAVMTASRLFAIVMLGGLDRARALPSLVSRVPGLESRANSYYPILRGVLMLFIATATMGALLEAWGFGFIDWLQGNGLGKRSLSAMLLIGVTVLLAVLVWEGVNASIEMHLARLSQTAQLARAGRLRTLLPMLRTLLLVMIVLVVALMTLDELGVNIAPLLAGAGVVGIAVGFGSQKLVQDLITGLFLLLENAMQVGDVVVLGGLSGTVEALSIRAIRLRAIDGSVHIIPFSAVTTVTNQTRDYGYAVLDVSVGLNEEPARIVPILNDVVNDMRAESRWQNIVLEPLDVMGVEKFVDLAWVMRVRLKTQPSSRWAVGRELNRRIKDRFDELAIESPITSFRSLSQNPAPPDPAPPDPAPAQAAPSVIAASGMAA